MATYDDAALRAARQRAARQPDQTVDYTDNADANTGNWQPPSNHTYDTAGVNVGRQNRMAQNAEQGVTPEAAPRQANPALVRIGENARANETHDWRVSLSVPSQLQGSNIFAPFAELGKLIFPFQPTILLGSTASYTSIHPTHTNQPFYAYENSQVDNLTITGEFVQENERDALYWIACLHYFRTLTKMFYAESDPLGNPPLVVRLNGYGKHVLNNIPVVITNFTTDMPQDVDYIQCTVNGEINYVPIQSIFTVTLQPQYARRSHSRFSLNEYINGTHIGAPEGFV
jgi:hypothetical protein